jgi:AAA ATPase domain
VPARGVVQSPVLVGRDVYLALVGRRLADAAAGAGQLLFVAGEAGIGKTRLLGVIARQAGAQGFAVVRRRRSPGTGSRSPACCWTWPATCCPHVSQCSATSGGA